MSALCMDRDCHDNGNIYGEIGMGSLTFWPTLYPFKVDTTVLHMDCVATFKRHLRTMLFTDANSISP